MASLQARLSRFPRERPLIALVVAILSVELVGASGAVFTAQGLGEWYDSLVRPAVAPPNWVFGPVWTALFALMGAALWLVWKRATEEPEAVRVATVVFVVHFAFNLGWSAAFFGMREIGLGLAVIAVLWALIVATMRAFARVDRRAALLLVPYLLWVTFAAYLNYQFWVLN
ncbi:TspO/MBR family protein [Halobellus captivus]|uniref:TspO/MBR family protein n=1 Tax=Halobellus captivus TaxID=2592614 RepID=UPI0011A760CB|nr:TspO/MBR family protein [Halobellus captivus]